MDLRVLEVFGEPIYYGGQETFVMNVLRSMDKTGMSIDLLTPYSSSNEKIEKQIEQWGGKVFALGLDFTPGKSRANIVKPLNDFLRSNRYDVVHVHSGSISVLALAARCAKRNGVKKVLVHSHCGIEKVNIKNFIMRQYGNLIMRGNVDVYCACSKVAGEAKFVKKIVDNRLRIIKNGVDLEKYKYNADVRKAMREKLGLSEDTFVVGHIGRFSYQKNHEFLLSVFKDYVKEDSKAVLLLVGDGDLKGQVAERVKELKLSEKVLMTGNVDNVNDYLQVFDVFLLPSRFEGLPIVGVEAQASGLPVIVSDKVSDELKAVESFAYLPIDQGTGCWIKKINEFKGCLRADTSEMIKKNGYDIRDTAMEIRNLYLGGTADFEGKEKT